MSEEKTEKRFQRRYSVAFRMKVVEEIENGLISQYAATRLYGVPSATLADWMKRYGFNSKIDKVVYVMTAQEEREILLLRKENKRLKEALDRALLHNLSLESLIEIAEEVYDPDLKKNIGSMLAEKLGKKPKLSDFSEQD